MKLVPWRGRHKETTQLQSPTTGMTRLRDEMERLFDRFFQEPWGTSLSEEIDSSTGWGPRVDLAEKENELIVKADLPGMKPEEVEINITGDVLTVCGEKKQESEEKQPDYHYVERQYGSFRRMIQLPCKVDESAAEARFKDGVLTITMPKHPESTPRRIEVHDG